MWVSRVKRLVVVILTAGPMSLGSAAMAGVKDHYYLNFADSHANEALKALAQAENKEQYGGHRLRAEELIRQARQEMKWAAEYAESHPGPSKGK